MEYPNSRNPNFAYLLFFFLIISILLLPKAVAITEPELDAAIIALRSRDYNLFGNAIAASVVRLDLLVPANSSFTLLAPPDGLLFALDMATPSPEAYIASLRLHVLPGRLTFSDLRSLPGDLYPLESLLPGREIIVSRSRSTDADFLTVDGVDVVRPGIFYGRDLAVHGLGGIISLGLHDPIQPPPASRSEVPPASRSKGAQSTGSGSELSPARSADPPVLGSPIDSPSPTPTISPDSSIPPSKSADPPVLGSPAPSPADCPPEASPADEAADDVGFPWKDWACVHKENGACVGTGWGLPWRTIGGWPRPEIPADGNL